MECNRTSCRITFHVTWYNSVKHNVCENLNYQLIHFYSGQAAGLLCEEGNNSSSNTTVKYCGYCQNHIQKLVRFYRNYFVILVAFFTKFMKPGLHYTNANDKFAYSF